MPEGEDIIWCEYLLKAQVFDLLFFKMLFGFTLANFLIILLQFFFTVPITILSVVLFIRLKFYFSASSFKNIKSICMLMIFENTTNSILRFFIGLKALTSDE